MASQRSTSARSSSRVARCSAPGASPKAFSERLSWARAMAAWALAFFSSASSSSAAGGALGRSRGRLASASARALSAASAAARSSATRPCCSGVSWLSNCFSAFFRATRAMLASIFSRFSRSLPLPACLRALARSIAACTGSTAVAGAASSRSAWAARASAAFSARWARSAARRSSSRRRRAWRCSKRSRDCSAFSSFCRCSRISALDAR
ncbi:Uncharacterised protein [Acinetobacter baumannii]|nr:Uncharacterised protein [Acinetobacter baumannii]